ncbi:MAG TPA: T9SS type A sorting domain-containing protein, partial [Bacteroidales bacterium]|nr:T9SS type A sorting domain-containing protein [Bacteroidales bacterium]
WIGDEYQISGVTPNDFSDTLYYKIVAGNNDTNVYKVYVDYETIITSKINETSFIFPNPTSNYIYINGFSNTEFKLYKLSGELEFSSFLKSDNEKIDISNFKAGTYFVMIRSTKYTISDKLLIN